MDLQLKSKIALVTGIGAIPLRRLGGPEEIAPRSLFLHHLYRRICRGANITMDGALGAFIV